MTPLPPTPDPRPARAADAALTGQIARIRAQLDEFERAVLAPQQEALDRNRAYVARKRAELDAMEAEMTGGEAGR